MVYQLVLDGYLLWFCCDYFVVSCLGLFGQVIKNKIFAPSVAAAELSRGSWSRKAYACREFETTSVFCKIEVMSCSSFWLTSPLLS